MFCTCRTYAYCGNNTVFYFKDTCSNRLSYRKNREKSIAMMQNSNKNTEMRFSYAEQVKRDGIRNITSEITDGLSSGTVSLNESKVTEVLSSVDTDSGTTILSKSEIGIEKITLFKDVLIIHTDKEIV